MTQLPTRSARAARRLRADRRGAAALEFAMVGGLLVLLLLGCVEVGLMMWTGSALQSVAAQTARCTAIGSCSNPQQYAVSLAGQWIGGNAISTNDVSVAAASSCHGQAGAFAVVTISESIWADSFFQPIVGGIQSVTACFPTG